MLNFRLSISFFVLSTFLSINLQGRKVEILAVRHTESMNNILSGAKEPQRFVKDICSQRNKIKVAGGEVVKNPVLSHRGREAARTLHNIMFRSGDDQYNIFNSENSYKAVFVSPLHRTIQTAMLLFGTQLYKKPTPLIPEINLSEYRKSISEDGSKLKYLIGLFVYEQIQLRKFSKFNQRVLESDPFQTWQGSFIEKAKACCTEAWWPMGGDLEMKKSKNKEKAEHIAGRIKSLKQNIAAINKDKVILVSHGGFLRAFFYGVKDLAERTHLFKNLGFMKADLDTETGKLSNKRCWDPLTGKDAELSVCLRKFPSP